VPVETINTVPMIISDTVVEAAGDVLFGYTVRSVDSDGPSQIVQYENFPAWLTPDADSIFGTPPDGLSDTSFLVIVSDGIVADSLEVTIDIIPTIIVYGDTRTNHDIHQQVVDQIIQHTPAVLFHSGDLVADGRIESQWETFDSITAPLFATTELFPSLGNHEYQSSLYFDRFNLSNNEQWYSVDRCYTHFIILNSNVATDTASEQYQWLESDLAGIADSIRFVIAVFHHPPYSTGPHTEDEKGLRETFVPLFEQYGVDIVFNGHDHHYERSFCGGRYYIVTGGGGAPLRDQARTHPCSQLFVKAYHFCKLSVVDDRMLVRVYNLDAQLVDRFSLDGRVYP